ncbi:MAG: sigma-70 family RNA polymerase sigma factor [Phycisphaerae bacterium]|nr:sigma-70 family RNA polymerase sigma factor [Phycisphaerae bacterium]
MTSDPALPAGFSAHPALAGLPPSIATDPDVHLMMAFQDGNEDAFAQLIRRNQHKVFSVIYRFLGDRTESEDLVQEVFLRVYRTAGRYEPTAKFSTWLYRIATNISLNAIRNRSRFRPVSLEVRQDDSEDFHREIPDDTAPPPDTAMHDEELARVVMAAIDALPDQQKSAIILNKYEGLSYEDVATILSCSVMAVKSLLSRARSNLKVKLMPYVRK